MRRDFVDYRDSESRRFQPGRRHDQDTFWQCFDNTELRRIGYEVDRKVDLKLQRYFRDGLIAGQPLPHVQQPGRPAAPPRNVLPPPPPPALPQQDLAALVNDVASKLAEERYASSLLRKDNVLVHEQLEAAQRQLQKYKSKKKAKKQPPPITIDASTSTDNTLDNAGPPAAPSLPSPRYADALKSPATKSAKKAAVNTPRRRAPANDASTESSTSTAADTWAVKDLPGKLRHLLRGLPKANKTAITDKLREAYPHSASMEEVWAVVMPAGTSYIAGNRPAVLSALSQALLDNFDAIKAAKA